MPARTKKRLAIGTRVRIERDEDRYPPRGSWPTYRGKIGTVVHHNRTAKEFGVRFGSPDSHTPATWFLRHELVLVDDTTPLSPALQPDVAKLRQPAVSA